MKPALESAAEDPGWTRVSSFKPHLFHALVTSIACLLILVLLKQTEEAVPLVAGSALVAAGLIALNCKVVHRRGEHYRIATLFYSEFVTGDDVCMTVPSRGPLWSTLRVHLKRPARFGWMFSYVPVSENRAPAQGSELNRVTPQQKARHLNRDLR